MFNSTGYIIYFIIIKIIKVTTKQKICNKKNQKFNFKIKFSDKKNLKRITYILLKKSLNLTKKYNNIYINNNNKTTHYINIK